MNDCPNVDNYLAAPYERQDDDDRDLSEEALEDMLDLMCENCEKPESEHAGHGNYCPSNNEDELFSKTIIFRPPGETTMNKEKGIATKPAEPDSLEWWRSVAQGLGVKVRDLERQLAVEKDVSARLATMEVNQAIRREDAERELAELRAERDAAWNEIRCCDDVRLDQGLTVAIADLQRAREAAESRRTSPQGGQQ